MTFTDLEYSNYSGQPVALYEFKRGETLLCYSSTDRDITANGRVYKACNIMHGALVQKGTPVTDVFEITAQRDLDIVGWFRYTAPSDTVYVIVRRFHYGDSEAVIAWIGQIVAVSEKNDDSATIKCQAVSITLRRGGLRLAWQRGCPHALYDQNCRVDKSAFAVNTTVTSVGGISFTVGGLSLTSAFWPGGIVEWQIHPGTYERRPIESVAGTTVFPFGGMDGYVVGMAVTLYPGCKRTSSWCISFFNNLTNYGGFPFMPNRTPYNGDPVF